MSPVALMDVRHTFTAPGEKKKKKSVMNSDNSVKRSTSFVYLRRNYFGTADVSETITGPESGFKYLHRIILLKDECKLARHHGLSTLHTHMHTQTHTHSNIHTHRNVFLCVSDVGWSSQPVNDSLPL